MAALTGLTEGNKAYTSVQCGTGPDDHVELNSDLVYGMPYPWYHVLYPNIVYS
jgi:hypothetical protein